MKVLVTGATGFVGGWLTKALLEKPDCAVSILARRLPEKLPFNRARVSIMTGDVTDAATLAPAMSGVDVVFHLAGVVGYRLTDRKTMERVNIDGTAHILQAVRSSGVKKLIYMSSVAAVGASFDGKTLLNENSPYNLSRLNLGYFETKHAAEELVLEAARSGAVHAVALNPSNIYGPGDAQKGSRSTQVKVARGAFPFYTSGGVSIVHVNDVVQALIAAVDKGRSGERYILSGENIGVRDMFQIIAETAGAPPPRRRLPNFAVRALAHLSMHMEQLGARGPVASESARAALLFHWFDCAKAQRELGYKFTPAREAIASSVKWMKDNGVI